MPYSPKQRRYIYAQASKGVAWAKKEVESGKAKTLHKAATVSRRGRRLRKRAPKK